jgi:translation initiation factor IF-2
MKVFELAKELDIKALDLLEKIKPLDLQVKNHMSSLTPEQETQIRGFLSAQSAPQEETKPKKTTTRKTAEPKEPKAPKKIVVRTRKPGTDAASQEEAPAATASSPEAASATRAPTLVRRKNVIVRREVIADENAVEAASSEVEADSFTESDTGSETLAEEARNATLRQSVSQEEEDPLLQKDEDLTKDLATEFTEEMFTQSRSKKEDEDNFSAEAPPEVAPPEVATAAPVEGGPRRLSRYSVIRVVSPDRKSVV